MITAMFIFLSVVLLAHDAEGVDDADDLAVVIDYDEGVNFTGYH